MATNKQCLFFWNGREADGGGSFSLQTGVDPSSAVLRMRLSYPVPQFGTLRLTDGDSQRSFANCRVVRSTVTEGNGGARWREVQVEDRRWAWADGHFACYGEYNVSLGGISSIDKTARELAVLLCIAMGETGYDVSALPNTPASGDPTAWDGDSPATMLMELCAKWNCIPTLSNQDTLVVRKLGVGQLPSPDSRQMDFTQAVEPEIIPAAFVFEGGETHMQHELVLEAVGMEITGDNAFSWVPVDDLSYKPAGGWGATVAGNARNGFMNVQAGLARQMARAHIWHAYRIRAGYKSPLGKTQLPLPPHYLERQVSKNGTTVPINPSTPEAAARRKYFQIGSGDEWRILPLNDFAMNTRLGGAEPVGVDAQLTPVIVGFWYEGNAANRNTGNSTEGDTAYGNYLSNEKDQDGTEPFLSTGVGNAAWDTQPAVYPQDDYSVDWNSGIVKFNSRVFYKMANDQRHEAILRLIVSFPLRDPNTAARTCQQHWSPVRRQDVAPVAKMYKDSEFSYRIIPYGRINAYSSQNLVDNSADFVARANNAFAVEAQLWQHSYGYSAPYKGFIFGVNPDGIIRTVQFDVSEMGEGTTHIDYNMERPESYLTLDELRTRRWSTYLRWKQLQIDAKKKRNIRDSGKGNWGGR